MASTASQPVLVHGSSVPRPPGPSAPLETLATLRLAVSLATMSGPVRAFFETMLDCMEADASLIAALKAAHAELQQVVELLAQNEGSAH